MLREKAERLRQLLEAEPAPTLENWDRLYRAALELDAAHQTSIAERLAEERRKLEQDVAPELAARLARDPDAVRAGLVNPGPAVRRLALFQAGEHKGVLSGQQALLQALVERDPEEDVRRQALFYLAREAQGSNDPALGIVLARLVAAETEPDALRLDAYRALIYLIGQADRWEPMVPLLRFPEDVDWALVHRFLPAAQAPERSAS